MLLTMGRVVVAFGLPWAAMLAIAASLTFAMSLAFTSSASRPVRERESVPTVNARPVGSDTGGAWSVYVGGGCWIPDPTGIEACASKPPANK
jgi:hypothetical protein